MTPASDDSRSSAPPESHTGASSVQEWKLPVEMFPAHVDFFGRAVELVRKDAANPSEIMDAVVRLEELIGRRLLISGFPAKEMAAVESQVASAAFEIYALVETDASITSADDDRIESIIATLIARAPAICRAWHRLNDLQNEEISEARTRIQEDNPVDASNMNNVNLNRLYYDTAALLEKRLCELGLSQELSAHVTRRVMNDFKVSRGRTRHTFATMTDATVALDFATSVVRVLGLPEGEALQRMASEAFGEAAKFALPERAPAIWKNRADRLDGETSVQFLDRIWGPYIRAGVCYQDTIGKLGDPMLVPTVRAYCHRNNIDPATVLPPPRHVRTDRELAAAVPGSAEALLLKSRMRARLAARARPKRSPS